MEKRIAAGGVVVRKTEEGIKVLLIKDSYGHWIWPKGHREQGETSRETALREVQEETGLSDLDIIDEAGPQEYTYDLDGVSIIKKVYIYLMETTQEELIIQTEEIKEGKWFSPEEALDRIEYEGSKTILKKAVDLYEELRGGK